MPVHPGCIVALTETAVDVWGFVRSNEGQLLIALILGAHAFSAWLRRFPGPEPADFANTLMVAIVFLLFVLATESNLYLTIKSGFNLCTGQKVSVAALEMPRHGR